MYLIALNRFLDPVVVWLDEPPQPTAPHDGGQRLLDEGREMSLLLRPSLVT